MGSRIFRVTGFEEALADKLASSFRFSSPELSSLVLAGGRNIFVDELPEVEDISDSTAAFDPNAEPTIGIYTKPGPGQPPAASSGSRMEFNVDILLRFGRSMAKTKGYLGEVINWCLANLPGAAAGVFLIRAVVPVQRPVPFERFGDDHAVASSTLRFLVVPLR